jgi:arabinan endo-1,5-alpha-L-arabinosidase
MKKFITVILSTIMAFSIGTCGTEKLPEKANDSAPQTPGGKPAGGSDADDTGVSDTVGPAVSFAGLITELQEDGYITLDFSVTDDKSAPDKINITVLIMDEDGTDVTGQVYTPETKTFTPPCAGDYILRVTAVDEAGNSTRNQCVITVSEKAVEPEPEPEPADTSNPMISFSGLITELQAGGSAVLSFSVSDDKSARENITVTVVITNGDNVDVTGQVYTPATKTFTPVSAGNYILRITAEDEAGNSAVSSRNITVRAGLIKYVLPTQPDYGNSVSVHDPSIFKDDDGKYYTFGSHFDAASSTDLMKWTQFSSGNNANKASKLYGSNPTWQTILADAFTHVGNDGDGNPSPSTWAPDVIKIGGKYYMYYSLSLFGSGKSYIGRVEANAVTGPYSNSREVIKSFTGGGNPNAIDPCLFYDADSKLWMVYGSFFGGIYILEMETSGINAGLPKSGQNYGTRIWNGASDGPEGPYIFYNPETAYYYLMISHGSLSTDYNMRVARSVNPNGPYYDIQGNNTGSVANGGNKLAGNYQFAGASKGYAALGHNSVLREDGDYYVIYHSRYRSGTDGVTGNHNQFVNRLFLNSDGWPVLAPNRYAGEKLGRVDAADVAGSYDLVVHTTGNTQTFAESSVYSFEADGGIKQNSGTVGSWELMGDYYLRVTINGTAYNGVIAPQWNNDLSRAGLSVTATANSGVSLWANKKP